MIEINSSDKQVINVQSLYTGIATMKVKAINPTMEELKAMGIPAQKEPEYTTVEEIKEVVDGEEKVVERYAKTRIDIYLYSESPKITYPKLSFWIENRPRVDQKKTKHQWINAYGNTTWAPLSATSLSEVSNIPSWYKLDGSRIALPGEELLIEWLKALANVPTDGKCQLETIQKIAIGDLTELKTYFNKLSNQKVRYLLGVKDNQYQVVYDKLFGREYERSNNRWIKALEDQYRSFKADYQNDLTLRLFEGKLSSPDATQSENNSGSGNGPITGGMPVF